MWRFSRHSIRIVQWVASPYCHHARAWCRIVHHFSSFAVSCNLPFLHTFRHQLLCSDTCVEVCCKISPHASIDARIDHIWIHYVCSETNGLYAKSRGGGELHACLDSSVTWHNHAATTYAAAYGGHKYVKGVYSLLTSWANAELSVYIHLSRVGVQHVLVFAQSTCMCPAS